MCLAFIVFGCRPPQPRLLLAFNRDEYFKRPTQPLHLWEDGSGLLAGRDLGGGGTWLGINVHTGRLALLTNFRSRDPIEPSNDIQNPIRCASRGELVTNFLTGSVSAQEYVQSVDRDRYNGFNLVVGDLHTAANPQLGAFAYINNSAAEGDAVAVGGKEDRLTGSTAPTAAATDAAGAGHRAGAGAGATASSSGEHVTAPCSSSSGDSSSSSGPASSATTSAVDLLQPGRVYGLSNGRLMEWPKVTSGIQTLQGLLPDVAAGKEMPYKRVFEELLGDSRRLVPPKAALHGAADCPPDSGGSGGGRGGGGEHVAMAEPVADRGTTERQRAEKAVAEQPTTAACPRGDDGDISQVVRRATKGRAMPDGVPQRSGGGADGGVAAGDGAAAVAAAEVETFDVSSFREQLEHITSGRFVVAVQSPYGMYGTRSQTVMVVWHDGAAEVRERNRCDDGTWREVVIPFRLGFDEPLPPKGKE